VGIVFGVSVSRRGTPNQADAVGAVDARLEMEGAVLGGFNHSPPMPLIGIAGHVVAVPHDAVDALVIVGKRSE
jgi:hypothetical protein